MERVEHLKRQGVANEIQWELHRSGSDPNVVGPDVERQVVERRPYRKNIAGRAQIQLAVFRIMEIISV
jgi:hypothetical protein